MAAILEVAKQGNDVSVQPACGDCSYSSAAAGGRRRHLHVKRHSDVNETNSLQNEHVCSNIEPQSEHTQPENMLEPAGLSRGAHHSVESAAGNDIKESESGEARTAGFNLAGSLSPCKKLGTEEDSDEGAQSARASCSTQAPPFKKARRTSSLHATPALPASTTLAAMTPGGAVGRSAVPSAGGSSRAGAGKQQVAAAARARTAYALARPRRRAAQHQLTVSRPTESSLLVLPQEFIGEPGCGAALAQPFRMEVQAQALLVADLQAHLSSCEVIGLLGGSWDAQGLQLTVQEAYPCRCAEGSEAENAVELDAVSEVEVRALMAAREQRCVGWYHSHPVFEPNPSQKDMENQRNYQALFRDDSEARKEPFVGFIIGPYDTALPGPRSAVTAFVVQQRNGSLVPFALRYSLQGTSQAPDEALHSKVALLLDLSAEDPARVDMDQQWRAHTWNREGDNPEGPPMTKLGKLQSSLAHFMHDAEPTEVQAFSSYVQAEIQKRWHP